MLPKSLSHLEKYNIVLGSASPRRAELLTKMGLDFTIKVSELPEIVPDHIEIENHAEFLSLLKSKNIRKEIHQSDALLITSDTVVIHDKKILNKPASLNEARAMLQTLAGSTHLVQTGITVYSNNIEITKSDTAEVTLISLNQDEIDYYVDTFKPTDKAGAYGIQEWIGMTAIKELKGSFYTIMGLPTSLLYATLKNNFK